MQKCENRLYWPSTYIQIYYTKFRLHLSTFMSNLLNFHLTLCDFHQISRQMLIIVTHLNRWSDILHSTEENNVIVEPLCEKGNKQFYPKLNLSISLRYKFILIKTKKKKKKITTNQSCETGLLRTNGYVRSNLSDCILNIRSHRRNRNHDVRWCSYNLENSIRRYANLNFSTHHH